MNKIGAKQPFTINGEFYRTQKLKLSNSLLRIGGDRDELKRIQAETSKELKEIKRDLEFRDKEIEVLKEKLRKCEEKKRK